MPQPYYEEWPFHLDYAITSPPPLPYVVELRIRKDRRMRGDYRDLRFFDPGTGEPNAYWIESGDATRAIVWIYLHANQTRLFVYYGNSKAVSESDVNSVGFVFADDFSAATLDEYKWMNVTGDRVTIENGQAKIQGSGTTTSPGLKTRYYLTGANFEMIARFKHPNGTYSKMAGFYPVSGTEYAYVYRDNSTYYSRTQVTAPYENNTLVASSDYIRVKIWRNSTTSVVFDANFGAVVKTHTGDVPTADMRGTFYLYNAPETDYQYVDYCVIRYKLATEPVLTLKHTNLNPYSIHVRTYASRLATPPPPYDFWADERIVSYSIKRTAADAMYRAEILIDGIIDTARSINRVQIMEPDHNEIQRLIFFGFFPAHSISVDVAANKTRLIGYDYGFYLSGSHLGLNTGVIPEATNPGNWMHTIFDDPGLWFDLSRNPAVDCMFDTSNVHLPTFDSYMPARQFVFPALVTTYQACQQIADELGWIFYARWLDVGNTPSYNHQDPAFRIIRVEAEDFASYYDTTPENIGGAYRNTGVDIEYFASEQGYNVGWIRNGEWLQYTVSIPVAGEWTARFRTAAPNKPTSGRWFDLYIDGSASPTVPAGRAHSVDDVETTASYWDFLWLDQEVPITFTAGTHTIKFLFGGAGDGDFEHMNLACFDLVPPPAAEPAESLILPALYFVDEADIDDPDNGLDLPPMAVIQAYDPTLAGPAQYVQNYDQVATAVAVRYRTPTAPDTVVETTAWDTSVYYRLGLEMYVDHVEELRTPVTQATAEAYRDALLAYYTVPWGTVTAKFIRRSDLQLFQRITFVGHDEIPETVFRITDITYTGGLADSEVSIVAVPAEKFSIERQLTRLRSPDEVSEIQLIVKAMLDQEQGIATGTSGGGSGGQIDVYLDRGGTMKAWGSSANGARVICIPSEHHGYIAVEYVAP